MAKIGVRVKIAVNKIDKERLFRGKNTYLDMTTFIDLDQQDQYGNNGFCSQDVSKEEREQGVKGPILGNVQVFYRDSQQAALKQQPTPQQAMAQQPAQGFDDFPDDLAF